MNNAGCSRRSPLQQWNELLRHAGHPLLEVEAAQRRLTTWQPPGSWQHNRNPMIRCGGLWNVLWPCTDGCFVEASR
ncbi:uncharacterized protein LOC125235177 isoform X3 [Leguminivora glycinivorella]|uniref:uncharacterized protein LOC125235177 isoform X3 n=1 Tax=Leguminivora glycinivorella TaxID=1035111 RepID=UPI00200BB40D|nr:uncharacterized protein LOC125235177 isoform X3 [Leguminivora glycinivorella]